jgi:2-polyprenyl-3-methyl-5-hydroxy-6-metoxy-1,4-benzoquinol methylase
VTEPATTDGRKVADLRMKPFDKLLRNWRISKAAPYVKPGSRVLDIGSADGALFERFEATMGEGLGIDSGLERPIEGRNWRLIKGWFPEDLPDAEPFDVITMLAVLEHIPPAEQPAMAREVAGRLKPGGHLVITVPSTLVDPIVDTLVKLRLMRAVGIEQHWGFDPTTTPEVFAPGGLVVAKARRFQLGLNNLYVLRKDAG